MSNKQYHIETLAIHAGQIPDPTTLSRAVPVYRTTAYAFRNSQHGADLFALRESGNIYARLMNPTEDVLEKRLAAVEGGAAALAVSSGTAAVYFTIANIAKQGDEIVAANNLYGGTYTQFDAILPQQGIKVNFTPVNDFIAVEAAINEKTRAIYIETVGNPGLDVADIEGYATIAKKHHLPLIVDSTFTPPTLLRPIEYGANIVVHSLSKWIGGHGTAIGGVIVEGGKFNWKASGKYPWISDPNPSYHGISFYDAVGPAAFATYIRAILLRDTGSTLSPFHAFLFLQGLETLSLRVERHVENALKIVDYLSKHPQVEAVHHPSLESEPSHALYKKYFPNGGGSIFTFEVKGDSETAKKFIDNLAIFSLLANVADVKSLVIHPYTTTHSQLTDEELLDQGIKPNTIRLSIGTENVKDLIAALDVAFEAVK